MSELLVKRDDLRTTRVAETEPPELADGQARLRVDSFGLTANNITYAVFGDAMSYWNFFPAPEGWGHVPMWGFAEVDESRAQGVEAGARVYGYLPPASHLVVTPVGIDADGFVDGAPHRAELPSAYHRYLLTGADPYYRPDTEALQMLLRPLFFTSFLIDDQLDDDGLVERGSIVISSASSKTSIGAAYLLAQRSGAEIIGLTSPRSAEFVEGLGIYSRCVTYDRIAELEQRPATFVDVAGDSWVRQAVHTHLADVLERSIAVGVTHWEAGIPGGEPLPGPAPTFFFAPDRATKRSADWGRAGLNDRVAGAWHGFCDWTAGWLQIDEDEGFDAVERVYHDVLEARVTPDRANVLRVSSAG